MGLDDTGTARDTHVIDQEGAAWRDMLDQLVAVVRDSVFPLDECGEAGALADVRAYLGQRLAGHPLEDQRNCAAMLAAVALVRLAQLAEESP